jgi:hypothetical protein
MLKRWFSATLLFLLLMLAALAGIRAHQEPQGPIDILAFLIPDDLPFTDVSVRAWIDAAQEEGLHLQPVHAHEFLRPALLGHTNYAGVVLPDGIHRNVSQVLIDTLTEYVQQGGKLMLVFDAGTLNLKGGAVPERCRLSALAGVQYALYKELGDYTIVTGPAIGTPETLTEMNIPPGKYHSVSDEFNTAGLQKLRHTAGLDSSNEVIISSYSYDWLEYGHFVTRGSLAGKTLMVADNGDLLAGVHASGRGQVLFINLPLTYLKLRTDGAPLHGFLRYFAGTMLQLPVMGNAPDGIGGLVMNWHIDSSYALKELPVMASLGFFEQGPYSIHITAGPDTNQFDDKVGLDVEHRSEIRKWIDLFVARGDEVGSHGGWIHNYFGINLNDENEQDFARYIELNNRAISSATGHTVREYSAPLGNHPAWVTRWLEQHGVRTHYYTGNVGQGPTRSYVNGKRLGNRTWTFPVSVLGEIATFEEAAFDPVITQGEYGDWLNELSDFTRDRALIRLIYFHPRGVVDYQQASRIWMMHTRELLAQGKFRWYTMARIADFLDRRELVHWEISKDHGNRLIFNASHPQNLAEQSWRFPKDHYAKPVLQEGAAVIRETATEWVVVAGNGRQLSAHVNIFSNGVIK